MRSWAPWFHRTVATARQHRMQREAELLADRLFLPFGPWSYVAFGKHKLSPAFAERLLTAEIAVKQRPAFHASPR